AERVDVRGGSDVSACRLLRRHVPALALGSAAGVGDLLVPSRTGDSEIAEVDRPRPGDQDIVGGDVAMHEMERLPIAIASVVGGVQGARDVGAELGGERVW